jgi:hypothetical protein
MMVLGIAGFLITAAGLAAAVGTRSLFVIAWAVIFQAVIFILVRAITRYRGGVMIRK